MDLELIKKELDALEARYKVGMVRPQGDSHHIKKNHLRNGKQRNKPKGSPILSDPFPFLL